MQSVGHDLAKLGNLIGSRIISNVDSVWEVIIVPVRGSSLFEL